LGGPGLGNIFDSRSIQSFRFEETSTVVDILDDGGYVEVVEDAVNREIVVIEVLSSELNS
jgi:hypothetical protein